MKKIKGTYYLMFSVFLNFSDFLVPKKKRFQVHRLMLADTPRTTAYQKSIEGNSDFFRGKTVMGQLFLHGVLSYVYIVF